MLDFLEEVVVGSAVLVAQGESAVGGNACHVGIETVATGVLIGVQLAVVAVECSHVALVQVVAGIVFGKSICQLLDAGADAFQQRHKVVLMARDIDE